MAEGVRSKRLHVCRANSTRIAILLTAIWVLGIIIGVISFYYSWNRMPALIGVLMATTLLGPIAIPKSFGDIVGITNMYSTQNTLLIASIYWPVILALHWLAIKTTSYYLVFIVGIIVLLSAFNWINVGASMMGI